jgi:hypothetical protein
MLTLRCSRCKKKLIKYRKIGSGRVLKCYKDRVTKYYQDCYHGDLLCRCGNLIGVDMGLFYKMNQSSFIYSGVKES